MVLAAACALGTPTACRTGSEKPADLALLHGHVVTLDPARPRAEAIAVRGERIVAVGTDEDVARLVGPATRVIDLAGRLADGFPGPVHSCTSSSVSNRMSRAVWNAGGDGGSLNVSGP